MAVHSSVTISTSNLYLFYDIGNSNSYGGSGNTITDLSGNNRNGTITGATYASGLGGVLMCDGSGDYITPSNVADSFWQNSWTVSIWVKFDNLSTSGSSFYDRALVHHGTASTRKGLHLAQRDYGAWFGLYGDDLNEETVNFTAGTWYNIVYTCQKNTSNLDMKIYINGVAGSSKTSGGLYTGTGSNTRILGKVLSFGYDFDGDFSNVAFYDAALSASTIQSNYEQFTSRFSNTLQTSGPISLLDIQNKFGGSNPIGINEYYGVDTGVPASGTISFEDFYGTAGVDVADVLLVGGGGRGGSSASGDTNGGGGGGAGGLVATTTATIVPGSRFDVRVGDGGTSSSREGTESRLINRGDNSVTTVAGGGYGQDGDEYPYQELATKGGGAGGAEANVGATRNPGGNGGSIVGSFPFKFGGGGGGGAVSNGANNSSYNGGNGGNGFTTTMVLGTSQTFGSGGGGGGGDNNGSAGSGGATSGGSGGRENGPYATSGLDGYGGGGGGAPRGNAGGPGNGGTGGVYIRFPDTVVVTSIYGNAESGLYTDGGVNYRYYWFKTAGNWAIYF